MTIATIDTDHFNKDNIARLFGRPESNTLEFKREVTTESLLRNIAALANTDGGLLVVGVEESGHVVGCDLRRLRRLVEQIAGKLSPKPQVSLHEYDFDSKGVGVVAVGKSPAPPVIADGSFFVRDGDTTRFALAHELAHLLINRPEHDQIAILVTAVERQSAQITTIQEQMENNNSWRSKVAEWIYAGIVGAVIALALGWLVGLP